MKRMIDINRLIGAVKNVLPSDRENIGLHEPYFAGNEWKYMKECIDTGWVSYLGKFVDTFEAGLSEVTGAKKAIAVVNGTAALHLSLKLSGVNCGDEVLMPALTFVATANAVAYCGGTPHFVESSDKTLGIDVQKLLEYLDEIAEIRDERCYNRKTGNCIRAIIPMHTFGHPVDLDPLALVAGKFKLELIEDAAESLGSYYKGKHTGNWGKFSVLSFNGNKIVTTGGGGAILTNDVDLGNRVKHLTTTAKAPHEWEYRHDDVGYNYRLPNINAALGCAQLEQLPMFLEKKRALAARYEAAVSDVEGVRFFREPSFARSNYWLNVLILDEECEDQRDEVLRAAHGKNILMRPVWNLMHTLTMYEKCPRMGLPVAESLGRRIVNIPSSVNLEKETMMTSQGARR